jgi:hypothetical protein
MPSSTIVIELPPRIPSTPMPPKKVQRPAHVAEQETDGQQVVENPQGAADAIVALAPFALHVADGNLRDRSAGPARQR